jgi:hypothetical protein
MSGSTEAPEALISFSLNVPAHNRTAYLFGSCNEIELKRILSTLPDSSRPDLTCARRAPTVCRISEAVKGSRGCARLGGIFLVDESETILDALVAV